MTDQPDYDERRRMEFLQRRNRDCSGAVEAVCATCGGTRLVGGFVSPDSGYQDEPCPDCANPAPDAMRNSVRREDDRPIPTYGQIPWKQLGRDVMDAMYAKRTDYEFDPSYYPGHQMLPTLNFNSLARIVDKYRWYRIPFAPVPSPDGARWLNDLIKAAEAFRVAVIYSRALDKVPQDQFIDQLRTLESALNPFNYRPSPAVAAEPVATVTEFTNEIGNAIRITIEGPTSKSTNDLTPLETAKLNEALTKHFASPLVRGDREATLDHRVVNGREDWFLLAHELSEARDAYLNGMGQQGSAARRMRLEELLWNDKGTFIQALQAMSLSLPVQPAIDKTRLYAVLSKSIP